MAPPTPDGSDVQSPCIAYFDLRCYAGLASPVCNHLVDVVSILLFLTAAVGMPVLVLASRQLRRSSIPVHLHASEYRGQGPRTRPTSMEISISLAILLLLSQAVSLRFMRELKPLNFRSVIFKEETPSGAADVWLGILEDRLQTETSYDRQQLLLHQHEIATWIDTGGLLGGCSILLACLLWACHSFSNALKTLGPTLLTLNRVRESMDEARASQTRQDEGVVQSSSLPRPLRPQRDAPPPTPSPPLSTSLQNLGAPIVFQAVDSPTAVRRQQSQAFSPTSSSSARRSSTSTHASLPILSPPSLDPRSPPPLPVLPVTHHPSPPLPKRLDASLEAVEWQLRVGAVRVIRSALGWVCLAVAASLVTHAGLRIPASMLPNGLTAYYLWLAAVLTQ
ncbi:hypothetical protein DFJ73DRAFT_958828 [Zopfochytrium polystomum]|nr:hypothetical protein DFJ73DRAFT_958828 [Zopfochytrium polystomum]